MPILSPFIARLLFLPSYGYTKILSYVGFRNAYDRIDDTIYVGIIPNVSLQKHLIEQEKIGAVVSMNEEHELNYVTDQSLWEKNKIEHLRLPTVDFSNPRVEDLYRGVEFLRRIRREKKTAYIHCKAGRQRSANLAACYLIDAHGMSSDEAARHVRSKRPSTIFGQREIQRLNEFSSFLKLKFNEKNRAA